MKKSCNNCNKSRSDFCIQDGLCEYWGEANGIKPLLDEGWQSESNQPTHINYCLVYAYSVGGYEYALAKCIHGTWHKRYGSYHKGEVKSWMELPQPPAFA